MRISNRNRQAGLVGLVIGLCLFTLTPTTSLGAVNVDYHWAPAPLWDALGNPFSPAVAYEIWLAVDHGVENIIATVSDTNYALSAEPGKTYNLCVRGIDAEGNTGPMGPDSEDYVVWPVEVVPAPESLAGLGSAYPNPFNPRTTITFQVPEDLTGNTSLSLEIFDMRGRLVRRYTPDRSPGAHTVTWEGIDGQGTAMPSGIYVARYICGAVTATLKMTLVR